MEAEVFLGGSCGTTTWRRELAIPLLEAAGITYFDPQLPLGTWTNEDQLRDMQAKAAVRVLLFVISGETASVAAVAEAAYLLAARRPLALAVQDVRIGAVINGQQCDARLADDLNRGRTFLRAMALAHGVTAHTEVEDAVKEAIARVHEARSHLTLDALQELLHKTTWRSRQFKASALGDGFLVWIEDREPDGSSGRWQCWKGRSWFVHRSETPSQVVQTLLKAALTWEEHEAREHFRFAGQAIFDPHLSLETLLTRRREQLP